MRRRADAVLLLAAGAGAGVVVSFGVSKIINEVAEHRVAQDAAVVFCLSPAERDNLVEAAVSLGLAGRGSDEPLVLANEELTPQEWRNQQRPEFERACTALIASRRSPRVGAAASGFLTMLGTLLSAAFGAILTSWRDVVARGRQEANELRAVAQAFIRAAEAFIAAWSGPRSTYPAEERALVRERRGDLVRLLGRVAGAHPDWTVPLLSDALSAGFLGEALLQGWNPNDASACAKRAQDLEKELQRLDAEVGVIAHALEHPGARTLRWAAPSWESSHDGVL